MPAIFPFMQEIYDGSRQILLLSNTPGYTPARLESRTTSRIHLHLPEVCAPAQYLIDMGLRPALARRLSGTYMDVVARYRETCQSYFERAIQGGGHLTEYYCEVFIILFKRTIQAWGSQIVSTVRVRLCQSGAPQATTVCPERVDIRVDNAAKAEIIARLGLTSDKMMISPSTDVTSRLEEMSEKGHTSSIDTVDSRLMLSELSPISTTAVISRPLDPFCQPAPPTCFPVPYPPPPQHSLSYSPQRALATSFVPPARPRNLRSLANYTPDVSSLADLFGRMTVTALKTQSTNREHQRALGVSESDKINLVSPSTAANWSKEPHRASIESITSPTRTTTTVRRRKIAALPTRRGKTLASPSPPVSDLAGATSYSTPRVVEKTPDHTHTSQKTRLVPTPPLPYTPEAPCFATPKCSTPRQRKTHALRKTLPQTQPIPQNQTLNPLATPRKPFPYNVSRSPPLVSDATSYFDSPPTSSDELDTPPSTPPSSHVLLASTSTESLTTSSESDRIVSHKEPLGNAKLPYPRQRYRRLDFMRGGLGRDEQPLTFTFSV